MCWVGWFVIELCVLFLKSVFRYLNNWDKKIPNLDVADDYRSEREEIHKAQGKNFPFSFGDVSKWQSSHFFSKNNSFFFVVLSMLLKC